MSSTAELLLEVGCELGESPVQLANGDLAWVDILAGLVYQWNWRDAPSVIAVDESVGAIAETTDGTLVAACRSGLRHFAADGTIDLLVSLPPGDPDLRMNDGKADPRGRFVGGTMTFGEARPNAGTLWSFEHGRATALVPSVTISNGLAWDKSGEIFYFIDTPNHRIDAFDYDLSHGTVSNRRPYVDIDPVLGDPDGMCIDADGGLWVAMWGGSVVLRFDGTKVTERIDMPTPYVTCPVFVGSDLDRLVITTASEPFDNRSPAGAGDLYIVDTAMRGIEPYRVRI